MAPKIKLTYFGAAGRAELTRLIFTYGGIEFEDERIQFPQWAELKPNSPWGSLPFLDIDGVKLAQTLAMARYAGALADLYPSNPLDAARVDEILAAIDDVSVALGPSFFEKDMEKKLAMRKTISEGILTQRLKKFDEILGENGTGYIRGDKLTVADLALNEFLRQATCGQMDGITAEIAQPYANLKKHFVMVNDLPQIKKWRETNERPVVAL
eukprot:GFYU01002287.1.p1 GENE.GFYU01002287.1~~GFYU01002287.1.p1  ORF type:complete len:231 (+),score=66.97 GFYU01002287.1:60-695(+)